MYSMVLMMAMSTSPEVAACHKSKGCDGGGCTGVVVVDAGCTGCNGCDGGHKLFGGKGCGGGLFKGGLFKKHGCNGGGCNGCSGSMGCDGGAGCSGAIVVPSTIVVPEEKKEMPKKEEKKGGVTFAPVAPAFVTVNVPADAKVTIDGNPTISASTVRVYATPNLASGTVHYYTFAAQVVRNGRVYTTTERVAVEAGAKVQLTLNPNVGPAVASK